MAGQTTVIIPSYNAEIYLPEALDSVRAQTRAAREIIVIDDGSTNPVQPPDDWDGPPLRIIHTPNQGLPAARNLAISLAEGKFIALLDADDAWAPDKLEHQEQALAQNPDAVGSYCRFTEKPGWLPVPKISYPSTDIPANEFWKWLWHTNCIRPSTVIFRREAVEHVGNFNENLRYCEDYEYWFRLLRFGRFIQVPEPLCYYRMHPNQMTKEYFRMATFKHQSRLLVMKQHPLQLQAAGIPPKQQLKDLNDAYREGALLTFYERDLAGARRLLWNYLLKHPGDLQIMKYAFASLLPRSFLLRLRDSA